MSPIDLYAVCLVLVDDYSMFSLSRMAKALERIRQCRVKTQGPVGSPSLVGQMLGTAGEAFVKNIKDV